MAKNDLMLLDQLLKEFSQEQTLDAGEAFEIFATREVLKDYDISQDELELGIVDGRDDGGIDGWYVFVDGEFTNEPDEISPKRDVANIEICILTAKHHATFKQDPVTNLHMSLISLLDLSIEDELFTERFNDEVLQSRTLFKEILLATAKSSPKIDIKIYYLSRGDVNQLGKSISVRSDVLKEELKEYFSNCSVSFEYVGAAEILCAYRKLKDFSSVLIFDENPTSRGADNYIGLIRLSDYMKFITDDNGNLRRYLFESNVRDYMGQTFVNKSILQTLKREVDAQEEDFWWLNNGVTVLCDKATPVGKQLHLENVQIVNGLQTTETIYKYFSGTTKDDSRCVLVKVLITPDKKFADSIILATNNQNKVDFASLRATDKIQRDIEDLLLSESWFYDRRKNYYLNHGKPTSRIISMKYMAWAILSLMLGQPYQAGRTSPKQLLNSDFYNEIFSDRHDLRVYLYVLEICKRVEQSILELKLSVDPYTPRTYATMFRFLYAHLYIASITRKTKRNDIEIMSVFKQEFKNINIKSIHKIVVSHRSQMRKEGRSMRKLHRSESFQNELTTQIITQEDG